MKYNVVHSVDLTMSGLETTEEIIEAMTKLANDVGKHNFKNLRVFFNSSDKQQSIVEMIENNPRYFSPALYSYLVDYDYLPQPFELHVDSETIWVSNNFNGLDKESPLYDAAKKQFTNIVTMLDGFKEEDLKIQNVEVDGRINHKKFYTQLQYRYDYAFYPHKHPLLSLLRLTTVLENMELSKIIFEKAPNFINKLFSPDNKEILNLPLRSKEEMLFSQRFLEIFDIHVSEIFSDANTFHRVKLPVNFDFNYLLQTKPEAFHFLINTMIDMPIKDIQSNLVSTEEKKDSVFYGLAKIAAENNNKNLLSYSISKITTSEGKDLCSYLYKSINDESLIDCLLNNKIKLFNEKGVPFFNYKTFSNKQFIEVMSDPNCQSIVKKDISKFLQIILNNKFTADYHTSPTATLLDDLYKVDTLILLSKVMPEILQQDVGEYISVENYDKVVKEGFQNTNNPSVINKMFAGIRRAGDYASQLKKIIKSPLFDISSTRNRYLLAKYVSNEVLRKNSASVGLTNTIKKVFEKMSFESTEMIAGNPIWFDSIRLTMLLTKSIDYNQVNNKKQNVVSYCLKNIEYQDMANVSLLLKTGKINVNILSIKDEDNKDTFDYCLDLIKQGKLAIVHYELTKLIEDVLDRMPFDMWYEKVLSNKAGKVSLLEDLINSNMFAGDVAYNLIIKKSIEQSHDYFDTPILSNGVTLYELLSKKTGDPKLDTLCNLSPQWLEKLDQNYANYVLRKEISAVNLVEDKKQKKIKI